VAFTVLVDLGDGSSELWMDRAHDYVEPDSSEFEPTFWSGEASWSLDGDLTLSASDITVEASITDLGANLWAGSLVSPDHGTLDAVCWSEGFQPQHHYDASLGTCVDDSGVAGVDLLPVPYVRVSGDGQCGFFPGLSLNEDFFDYPVLRNIVLRGAVLDTANLYFAHIVDSQWEGADLTGFGFGYATLSGTVDEHTVWPEGPCSIDGSTMACSW
jgi:hypothetical protein